MEDKHTTSPAKNQNPASQMDCHPEIQEFLYGEYQRHCVGQYHPEFMKVIWTEGNQKFSAEIFISYHQISHFKRVLNNLDIEKIEVIDPAMDWDFEKGRFLSDNF